MLSLHTKPDPHDLAYPHYLSGEVDIPGTKKDLAPGIKAGLRE
jgi:hypothetical protein